MAALDPAWIHVTWGAGGSTHQTSLDLAGAVQARGIDTCLHLTCTNMLKDVLDGALEVSAGARCLAMPRREEDGARALGEGRVLTVFIYSGWVGRKRKHWGSSTCSR